MVESMKETLEVQSCIREFPWLIQMVKSRRFHEYCDQHMGKLRGLFCCDCMTPPFCVNCFKENDHIDHLTIQSHRCSNQSGVWNKTISNYMDTSGIHTYKINNEYIVYINQRRENGNHCSRNNVSRKCKVCEWVLHDAASSALFCSVECKFRNALGSQLDELMENSSEDVVVETVVKKKHRRKGIPHRSPFY